MAYFTSLWQARIIENHRHEYENEKFNSLLISNTEIPRKTVMQRWRIYGHHTKRRMTGRLKKWFPKGSSVSNLYYYLKTDQTFPNFVLKSIIGFLGGIVLTYICFMFFVFQLSISLIHATIMSSIIGVLLTLGLAFSYRIRCLVFLLIPQFFSRVGRYTLTCYALVLILTGPATNTLKNLEVLSESMACSQEQIKSSVRQITQSMKTPFNSMRDSIKLMVDKMKRVTSRLNDVVSKIGILVTSIGDEIQTSLDWLSHVIDVCNRKLGTPYDQCMKAVTEKLEDCKKSVGSDLSWICNSSSVQPACLLVKPYDSICVVDDYFTTSFAATLRRRLRSFTARVKETFFVDIETRHTHTFSSNSSASANQVAAGIVTEIRHRADPLLKWLSWSSCVTSLFLLLIIFRAKYYQQMFETRSRFDNRYVTKELRELDLKRYLEGRETVLPLNRRERAKYISIMSYKLMASEKVYLTRAIVFMTITTFKLLIHMVADYSLYWILMNIRYHGRFQSQISPGPSDGGVHISGTGFVSDMIRSLFDAMTAPLITNIPSPVTCLPNPHPPDMKRYTQIAILILLLWLFALFEPYGLRLRHVIMGHYRPERAKARAVWLYNHILRTRGSFMKLARRKLHREYKYSFQDDMTFRHLVNSFIPWWCLKYVLNTLPNNEHCLLCNTLEDFKDADTKLISCETIRCPGVYCLSCFSDIGKLCTICLSPADYGDVSDVSLENGSSDEFSDDEGCGNTSLQSRNNGNERTSLIKKSNADNRKSIPKRKKEGGQYEACNNFSSDDEYYRKFLAPTLDYFNHRDNINDVKDGDNNLKITDNNEKSKNAFINDIKHENTNLKPFKTTSKKAKDNLRNRKFKCRRKFKQKHKTMTLKRASRSIFYRFFVSLSQYAIMKRGYKLSLNRFDFRRSSRYIRIHKSTHTKKLPENLAKSWKSLKRSNNKINKNVNRRPSLKLLYAKRFKSYPIQNSSLLINANIAKNIVGSPHNDNVGKSKKNGNKKLNDKLPKKGKFRGEQKKRCQGIKRMYKICSSCFISMKRGVTPSKEILHNLNNKSNPYSADKSNFKRRKKEKEHFKDRSNVAIENENTRNYRISTYLFDNLWIKGKFGKDGKIDDRQRDNDNEFVKDRKEAGDQQDKEMEQLKISKKKSQMKAAKCTPPFRDCKCKRKPENLRQSICTNNFSCFRKRCCCNVHSSNSDLIADDKNKAKNNMSPNKLLSSSRADPNITRRMNYYRSIGISDFENTSHIDARCQNNCRPETVIHPSTSQRDSPTGNGSGGVKFDFDRSTSLKSFKIKEVKLGISDRFLHLRIRNPLPIMKELYATLLEASKREKTKTHVENNYITAEKGVLALPAVESHECQCINEMKPVEHRTTQIYTRDKSNIKKQPKCITPRLRRDVEVHVTKETCTCATQYKTITEDKACSCMQNNTAQDFEDAESQVTESTESVCSLSEGTKTDTTICSRFEINYDESPRVKIRSKRRIHVVTKANRSTTTEKATLCDVSTITNDWWSPIVEKKLKKQNLFTKPIREERIKRKTRYARDRSVSTDGKIVTFLSRAQIIPTDASDILSPSRYLLESQRYYNELFSSRIYSPRVFPAIFLKAQDHGKRTSSRDSISTLRKGNKRIGKPKKFDKKGSPSFKTKIGRTRSDDSSLKH